MHNKHPHEKEIHLAGFSDRMVAFTLDTLLFVAGYLAALSILFPQEAIFNHSKGLPMAYLFVGLLIAYHAWMGAEGRRTIGKKLLGIRVSDLHGEPLPLHASILRSVAYLLSGFGSLGFLWPLFNKSRQSWHDIMVGSVVVTSRQRGALSRSAVQMAAAASLAAWAVVCSWQVALATPYYRLRTTANAYVGLEELETLQKLHKNRYGRYTERLVDLANLSSEPFKFMEDMRELFGKEHGIKITVAKDSYIIEARARNRWSIPVKVVGP